jgi:hypothetical protein
MDDTVKCPDCGGEMYVGRQVPRDGGTTRGLNERIPEMARARVAICNACDEGWRQNAGSDSWVRIVQVGTRHR